MSLSEVATSLDRHGDDLRSSVRRQLEQADQRITAQEQLRHRLVAILDAMRQAADPSVDQLVQTMEAMMQAKYFTPEQLTRLKERHREIGGEAFGRWSQQWAELNEQAIAHATHGTDPADPAVQALAQRWTDLMDDMTGRDRRILSSMYAKLDGKGPEAATLGVVSANAWNYIKRALAVGFGSPH